MSDIVLKDKNGNKNTYSGIDVINIADSEGVYNRYVAEPQGEIQITSNGTFDVKALATAKVNVAGGGSTECVGCIIEVDALPTENIDEAVLYKMGDSYYKYSEEFKDMLLAYGGDTASYIEMIEAEGMTVGLYYVKTRPTDNIEVSTQETFHIYYVEDLDDILAYGDFEESGTNAWMSLSDEMPYGGAITDVSQITTTDYTLYALVDNGWKRYLVPNGDIAIVANGTFDVTEKAEVTVNVETVLQEKTVTENGVVTADEGYDGLSKVTVSIPQPSGELEITENGTYDVTDKASVIVDVESESTGGATVNASLTHTIGKPMVQLTASGLTGTPNAYIGQILYNYQASAFEVTSDTTLTASVNCNIGDLVVAAIATRDTLTVSDGWTLVSTSGVNSNDTSGKGQRLSWAWKFATSATESITVTQATAQRLYINMVALKGATGVIDNGYSYRDDKTSGDLTVDKPSGLVLWGMTTPLWGTTSPYPLWSASNSMPIVQLDNSTQPRLGIGLDQSNDESVTLTSGTTETTIIVGSLIVQGMDNFYEDVILGG